MKMAFNENLANAAREQLLNFGEHITEKNFRCY